MLFRSGELKENFSVLKSESYVEDEAKFLFKTQAEIDNDIKEIENKIKLNPNITNDQIAEDLGLDIDEVEEIVKGLKNKGIISKIIGGIKRLFNPEKKILPEIKIMYSYEKRPEASGPSILPNNRTRPFCRALITADKFWTREEIQKISERLGYSVFKRAGGFWTHNGIHDPQCRHEWRSNIVVRKN